jgi:hypothetical protein
VAAEWVVMHESEQVITYYETEGLQMDGDLRRAWALHDFKSKSEEGALSRRVFFEFDCARERVRILSLSQHAGPMASGKVLYSNHEAGEWVPIPPRTFLWYDLRLFCSLDP